jgi:hypothetical protein
MAAMGALRSFVSPIDEARLAPPVQSAPNATLPKAYTKSVLLLDGVIFGVRRGDNCQGRGYFDWHLCAKAALTLRHP